jgi:hypothetical protein
LLLSHLPRLAAWTASTLPNLVLRLPLPQALINNLTTTPTTKSTTIPQVPNENADITIITIAAETATMMMKQPAINVDVAADVTQTPPLTVPTNLLSIGGEFGMRAGVRHPLLQVILRSYPLDLIKMVDRWMGLEVAQVGKAKWWRRSCMTLGMLLMGRKAGRTF